MAAVACALAIVPAAAGTADAPATLSTTEDAALKLPDACTWSDPSTTRGERLQCLDGNGKSFDATVPGVDEGTIAKARAGDGIAITLFGDLYAAFLPNNLKDGGRAFSLFSRGAKMGVPGAMFGLGYLYDRGFGVPADDTLATHWFETSASAGSVSGMFWTANSLENGIGVPKNEALAIAWYRRAADLGDTGAMGALSLMYRDGRGVPSDTKQADQWWSQYVSVPQTKNHSAEEILAHQVRAQPVAVGNIGGLIPYCMGHFDVCRLVVVATGLGATLSHQGGCGMPKDPDQTTKQTLGWLIEHRETQGLPVRNGILVALKSLWPC